MVKIACYTHMSVSVREHNNGENVLMGGNKRRARIKKDDQRKEIKKEGTRARGSNTFHHFILRTGTTKQKTRKICFMDECSARGQ